jgi:D-hexose-6-phosphate mutarotase
LVLKNFKSDSNFASLIKDIEELKSAFDGVTISYVPGESETVEKDGFLVIVQNGESKVEITDEQLNRIIALSEKVRNKIIAL